MNYNEYAMWKGRRTEKRYARERYLLMSVKMRSSFEREGS